MMCLYPSWSTERENRGLFSAAAAVHFRGLRFGFGRRGGFHGFRSVVGGHVLAASLAAEMRIPSWHRTHIKKTEEAKTSESNDGFLMIFTIVRNVVKKCNYQMIKTSFVTVLDWALPL